MIWSIIWASCLIGSLAIFAVVAVVVTIGGAADLRRMLRRLDDEKLEGK